MPRRSTSREDFLDGAARLFRRQGYNGTGLKEITQFSGAPWGSLYHHFPGGKSQLGAEAVRRSGTGYRRLMAKVFADAGDPIEGMLQFFELAADALEQSDYGDGCPIATTALDTASSDDTVRAACADVFSEWLEDLTTLLQSTHSKTRARSLALVALCALEGAIVLSRTLRTTAPLHDTADQLAAWFRQPSPRSARASASAKRGPARPRAGAR